jgi:hypothetical protein
MLLDVTPRRDRGARTLFVPDDQLTFDFGGMSRRDNVRQALTEDPIVVHFLESAAAWIAIQQHHPASRMTSLAEGVAAYHALVTLQLDLYGKYLRVDSLCPCDSGRKVGECCSLETWRP